jgi:hypothetical protein
MNQDDTNILKLLTQRHCEKNPAYVESLKNIYLQVLRLQNSVEPSPHEWQVDPLFEIFALHLQLDGQDGLKDEVLQYSKEMMDCVMHGIPWLE